MPTATIGSGWTFDPVGYALCIVLSDELLKWARRGEILTFSHSRVNESHRRHSRRNIVPLYSIYYKHSSNK